jgi:hypothetical protein
MFSFEQQAARSLSYASGMTLQNIKMIVSGVWMLTALVIAIVADVSWLAGIAIAALGVLPPLALLLWWNEPAQTMSESIRQAQQ